MAVFFASCGFAKPTAEEVKRTSQMDQKLEDAGYVQGTVIKGPGKDSTCEFLIELGDETTLELTEIPEVYRKAGIEVWIKWLPQRRPSLCGFQTAAIVEIQMR